MYIYIYVSNPGYKKAAHKSRPSIYIAWQARLKSNQEIDLLLFPQFSIIEIAESVNA